MSASAIVFGPFIVGALVAALADIGLRLHGGLATPTPAADGVILLAGHVLRLLAIVPAVILTALALAIGWRVRP
ncbi:hypothetical protein ASF28_09095 [Methylobacterium sp. Leaf99]|uniref:hypothetical protein n=1 Tax=Methylobacterium sp. Leaf99 TaxID=1736251 RepID=UPI0006FB32A3|nr:hypothetical protein [Methylobacterium sp. Leaf99]KQP11190.1 hypothetical protein ASF28_09095 [Methylobacterium sp. Leaf99]